MALDLSPERYGSKELPKGAELTGEEINKKAEEIAEAKKTEKIVEEVIKELEKKDILQESTISESTANTIPVETIVAIVEDKDEESFATFSPIFFAFSGFLIAILVAWLFFRIKIKRIRKQFETKSKYRGPEF